MNTESEHRQKALNNFQLKVGGEAGFGIMSIGQLFAKLCSRSGRWIFDYPEYPSLIHGGHNIDQVTVGEHPVHAPIRDVHLLIAMNQETIDLHRDELAPGAGILFDPEQPGIRVDDLKERGIRLFPVPLETLSHKAGTETTKNIVAFAAAAGLLNADRKLVEGVVNDEFKDKGEIAMRHNAAALDLGYTHAEEHFSKDFPWVLPSGEGPKRMNITGNTAVAMVAIQAGCKFYVAYPMTPATSVLSYLAKVGEKYGMVVRHAEDEIGVINAAIGAGYAGVRAMVGTSGGGFALMTEGVGLSAMLEVPIVILEGQRPGPSTGLPTWTAQADLQFVLRSSQGEFPRIIFAPGDVNESFYLTVQAFHLAEKYQVPVFVLTDKFLAESTETVAPFQTAGLRINRGAIEQKPKPDANGMFSRYRLTDSGVSPRTLPGTPGGVHVANSDEHDEYGFVDETAENRIAMMDKRMRKAHAIADEMGEPVLYGPKKADLTLVTWGSTKGPAIDALPLLAARDRSVNLLHFSAIFPLPLEKVESRLRQCKKVMMVEGNATGQFAQLLKEQVGLIPDATFFQYDGRPFFPSDIARSAEQYFASL